MAHQLFSETDDWELESDDLDPRGWSVTDEQGQNLGTVRDMLVDTDTETIDRLVLDDGTELDVNTVSMQDGRVLVGGGGMTTGATGVADDLGTGYETSSTDVSAGTTGATTSGTAARSGDSFRVRRHAEELRATTRPEQVGEVRIGKEVVEEERTLDVPVTHEEVEIRRVAVDRPAAGAQITDDGDTIRIPVTAERVDVSKEARVVEELEIEKTARTDTERVSDTVRREEIDVQREGNAGVADQDGLLEGDRR